MELFAVCWKVLTEEMFVRHEGYVEERGREMGRDLGRKKGRKDGRWVGRWAGRKQKGG